MLHKMVGHAVGAFASDEGGLDNYPNPHVRSNCFLVYRDDLAKFPIPTSKAECYLFEHGPQGLSRQLYPVAVASTGMAWSSYQWRDRRMFRQEDQADLLFSDNKTREYDLANPGERERLRRLAWGDAVPAEGM